MKTYISDIFLKIESYSNKLDNLTLLLNQHWVSIDNLNSTKTVYIFRKNNELLISTNGRIEKAKWEYIGNKSLVIENSNESYLFKHGFFDENILALKIDSSDEYAVFVNESKFNEEINTINKVIDLLQKKYLSKNGTYYTSNQNASELTQQEKEEVKKFNNKVDNLFQWIIIIILLVFAFILFYPWEK